MPNQTFQIIKFGPAEIIQFKSRLEYPSKEFLYQNLYLLIFILYIMTGIIFTCII